MTHPSIFVANAELYPYRIIIAEDDDSLASLLTRLILRRYPTAVVRAFGNGQDALAAYDQAGADLLFVNHGMPVMDGPTMIGILRARGDSVPIIGISGSPILHDENMAVGATAFFAGAEVLTQLSAILRRFFSPHRAPHYQGHFAALP
jgi:two-component system response regulator RegX3